MPLSRSTAVAVLSFAALSFLSLAAPLRAQPADSGRVQITVEESMGMRSDFLVQAAGRNATTDASGIARLTLPSGRQLVTVTRTGFLPLRVSVLVVRDSLVTVTVTASMGTSASGGDAMSTMARARVPTARTPPPMTATAARNRSACRSAGVGMEPH